VAKAYALTENVARWAVEQAGTRQGTTAPPDLGSFRDTPDGRFIFRNVSGETVPAFGCIKVTGVTLAGERYCLSGDKPDGTHGVFVFNSIEPVAAGENGVCFAGPICRAIVASDSANTLYNGECIGPDGWELASTPGGPQRFLGRLDDYSVDNVAFVLNRPASDCDDSSSDSDSVCQGISGVDLDALATVNAADVDYVLAIKDGCLVKVSLSECDNSGSV
jgi:hypothetical protein